LEGRRFRKTGDSEVWAKQIKTAAARRDSSIAALSDAEISVSWEDLGYPAHLSATVRGLWGPQRPGQVHLLLLNQGSFPWAVRDASRHPLAGAVHHDGAEKG